MNNNENMRDFNINVRSQKYVIFQITSVAKWGGTLLLSIWCTYNWYLLEVYDLGNMLDTIIGFWKRDKIFRVVERKYFRIISWNPMFLGSEIQMEIPHFFMRFHEKNLKIFPFHDSKKFSTHFQTHMMVCNMFPRS